MPQMMLSKLLNAKSFDMSFSTVEYLASALVVLELHDGSAPPTAGCKNRQKYFIYLLR